MCRYVHVCSCLQRPEISVLLGAELWVVMSCLMWALETELRSSHEQCVLLTFASLQFNLDVLKCPGIILSSGLLTKQPYLKKAVSLYFGLQENEPCSREENVFSKTITAQNMYQVKLLLFIQRHIEMSESHEQSSSTS